MLHGLPQLCSSLASCQASRTLPSLSSALTPFFNSTHTNASFTVLLALFLWVLAGPIYTQALGSHSLPLENSKRTQPPR
ncbi:Hypothetical predicted protein, partial [Marmota monax]